MVLKKSNSHLNTGVTQRLTNRGAILRDPNFRPDENPGTISVFLTGHEDNSEESWVIFQDGLNTIYDYLDLQGPDLSLFYDRDGYSRQQGVFNEYPYIKKETQGNASLLERVKKMIDAKVLEQVTQSVEVEINIFKRCPQRPQFRNNYIFSWKSTQKKDKPSNMKEERKKRRKKNNSNTHHRGIQRRNRDSLVEKHFSDEENSLNVPMRKIAIKIEEPYAVDARLVNKSYQDMEKRYSEERRKPGLKLKGFVNGYRSDFKGYNFNTLKEDETQALLEAAEEDDSFLYEDFRYTADEDKDLEEYSYPESYICLANYLTTGSKVDNKNIYDDSQSQFIPINSASSEKVVRYPKGSYVFMKATSEENDSDVDTDSGFEGNSSFKSDSTVDDQDHERQTVENIIVLENFEFELMANINDFISRYTEVQLILPPDIMDRLLISSTTDSRYTEDDCCISFGNCYPPNFLLKLNSNERISEKQFLYLTGKATQINDKHSWKWQVQVGKMNTCESEIEIVKRLMSTLQETMASEMTLKDLIHIFKESLEFHLPAADRIIPASTLSSRFLASQHKESRWCKIAHLMPMSTQTMSLAKALNILDNTNDRHVSESACTFQSGDNSSASASIVCDICFLPCNFFSEDGESQALALRPCGHVFCLTCWSSHVYVGLCNADSIHCMDSECKQELNETVLRSLAPGHMVNKWLQRLEDKAIERNPLSKWCPNTHCNKVAVLPEISAKIAQFGSLVLCDCQHHWCFSCQTEPHWPASCEQTAAFRKLLAKTGKYLYIPAAQVNYTIQLKRCPKCRYPIEKNEGCPSMVCRMCWFNFCWNCLRAVDHSVYSCKARDDNFDTFNLRNTLFQEIPLKFFPDYLEMIRKRQNLEGRQIFSWFQRLQLYKSKKLKMSLNISLEIPTNEEAKSRVIGVAKTTVEFLIQVYTFLESCYELLSFVNRIKDKPRKNINLILHQFVRPADTLRYIADRLEDQVVHKGVSQILKYAPNADVLIECGNKHMNTMVRDLHILQKLTKDVDTSRVGELDPKNYLRYK